MAYAPRPPDVSGGEGDASRHRSRPTDPASTHRAKQQRRVANAFDSVKINFKRENASIKMKRTLTPKEKKTLTEFLQIYKESLCLWDTSRVCYYNREQRKEAYVKLLAKYQEYDKDASCDTIKSKIENIRCAYRRERKKVLSAKRDGENHKPVLWYYDLMSFLDGVMEWDVPNCKRTFTEIQNEESDILLSTEYDASRHEENFNISNSISHSPQNNDNPTHSILPENSSENFYLVKEEVDGKQSIQPDARVETCYDGDSSTAFGRTVGLQLKELAPEQRIIAEKLISDIIFNARLNRLSAQPPYHNFE